MKYYKRIKGYSWEEISYWKALFTISEGICEDEQYKAALSVPGLIDCGSSEVIAVGEPGEHCKGRSTDPKTAKTEDNQLETICGWIEKGMRNLLREAAYWWSIIILEIVGGFTDALREVSSGYAEMISGTVETDE